LHVHIGELEIFCLLSVFFSLLNCCGFVTPVSEELRIKL